MDETKQRESLPRDHSRKLPKPITPIGASYLPPRPESIVLPREFPPYYPESLTLETSRILRELLKEKEYSDRSKLEAFCRASVSRLTPNLCTAVQQGVLKAHVVPTRLNELLHYLRVANCDSDDERFRIETAVINSGEWSAMVQQLIECTEIAPRGAPQSKASLNDVAFIPSDDYCYIQWGEEHYSLTKSAGNIVKELHEAHAEGRSISGKEIRSKTKCGRIWDAFRRRDGRKFWSARIAKTDQDMFTLRFDVPGNHTNKTDQL